MEEKMRDYTQYRNNVGAEVGEFKVQVKRWKSVLNKVH